MKRVLIVSYYFPPSGGPGVQRPLAMARHLSQYGWQPTVLTVDPAHAAYPRFDASIQTPPGVHVERTKARNPYQWYARLTGKSTDEAVSVGFANAGTPGWKERLARWIRANLFLPDARVGWVAYARAAAERLHGEAPFDAVVTTGPPHSSHLVIADSRQLRSLPWLVDLRDAWPDPAYVAHLPSTGYSKRKDARFRQRVYRFASEVIVVARGMERQPSEEGARAVSVVLNGFESSDFPWLDSGRQRDERARPPVLTLLHAGNLPKERNPDSLWAVAGRYRGRLQIVLLGNVDAAVRNSVEARGLSDMVLIEAPVPHAQAVRRIAEADALLLSINQVPGADAIVTGKVFEYVASGRPVVGIGPESGEAAEILRDSGAGDMVEFGDERALVARLEALLETPVLAGATAESARAYSRTAQTRKIAARLDAISQVGRKAAE